MRKPEPPAPVRNSRRIVGFAWAMVALWGSLPSVAQNETSAANVTQIKLEAVGWEQPLPPKPAEIDSLLSQRVTIDSQGRVLAGFTVRVEGEGLVKRAKPGLSFRVVRFTADGRPDLSLAVFTNNWQGNGVYLDHQDRIIARADDRLQMLVANGSGPGQREWKTLAPCGPHCEVLQSLSRRTFYVYTWDARPPVTILDMEDPGKPRYCEKPGYAPESITDEFAYFNYDPGGPANPRARLYRWPLCNDAQRTELSINGHSFVLPISDALFLLAHTVYGIDGKPERQISVEVAKHEGAGVQGIEGMSENGERLALTAVTWRGGVPTLDIGSHLTAERIIVYDLVHGVQLASIPIRPMNSFLYPAISPDGRRVAALANDTLTIADLP